MKTTVFFRRLSLITLILALSIQNLFGQDLIANSMAKARETFSRIDAENLYTDNLNNTDMNILPIGLHKTINNADYVIAVHSASYYKDYMEIGAFARIITAKTNHSGIKDTLFFGGTGIKLSYNGDVIGDAKLKLFKDYDINVSGEHVILRLKGNFDKETGQSQDLTYLTLDCKGYSGMGIAAEVILDSTICYKVNEKGIADTTSKSKVVGYFQTQITGFDDIVARVSFPAFAMKGLDGFVWKLEDAIFDFSDLRNENAMAFPQGYDKYLVSGQTTLWQGVYVKNLSITLPPQFSKSDTTKADTAAVYANRVSFSAQNMIIDDNGVTGTFGADNILSINEGNASGWEFSVDHFHLKLLANSLEEANFKGVLGIPLSKKTRLGYDGLIAANNKYLMKVNTLDTISFDVFCAKAEIDPNSYVEFKVEENKFRPSAVLNGRMGVYISKAAIEENKNNEEPPVGSAFKKIEYAQKDQNNNTDNATNTNATNNNSGGKTNAEPNKEQTTQASQKTIAEFKGIEFRTLKLQTVSPYLSVEYFGYNGEVKLANFPLSLANIALTANDKEASLGFDMKLALMNGDFGADTRLAIVGALEGDNHLKWKFKKVDISRINVNATIANMMKISGGLTILNDDPVYGDGFSGDLSVNFTGGPVSGLSVKMRGMFGKTDFRYWFVDGAATLPGGTGLPIAPGLFLSGFGGGLSYRMKATGETSDGSQILTSTSMKYVPDSTYNLGIKASASFAVVNRNIASGEACFELAFNNHGGLNYAGFYGYAQFVGTIPGLDKFQDNIAKKYKDIIDAEKKYVGNNPDKANDLKRWKQYDPDAAGKLYSKDAKIGAVDIKAALGIQYNFAESSFHATFDLYVNAAGGLLTGAASGNRAGWAILHVDKKDKYIHMGTPTDRLGLKIGLGNILNIETGSYFMAGNKIPDAPGLPPQVAAILKEPADNLDYMGNLNALADGKGVAFGANFAINTGDISFLILYARFAAGMGFDIMLKDYGEAQCKGHSGAIGIDGWYANGQAYAYLSGELGVKVNLWFIKAKVPIITADFAALMQAKLPNPSSFKAYLAVKAKVLGIIKVNCRFKLSIGDECELLIPGGSPVDMIMITDLAPTDASSDVSVFTAPQATFAMPIGKPFNVEDDEGEKTFRIQLKDFTLVSDSTENVIGNLKWNTENDVASFYSHEILPKQKEITATVNVIFEEYKNNRWSQVYTSGKEAVESKTIKFVTGDAPEDIPLQNIVYSYPVVDQKYYLKDESKKGYIQLQFGQKYLFPAEMENKVEFVDKNGGKQQISFTYNEAQKRIDYTMPNLQNGEDYTFNILSLSKGGNENAATSSSQTLLKDSIAGDINIETKNAVAETRSDIGKTLLAYNFATSRYSTFKQKIDNIVKGKAVVNKITSTILKFEYETQNMEPFDLADLTGTERIQNMPLISVEAVPDDEYYTTKIEPLVYNGYPINGNIRFRNRDENDYGGIVPLKALPIMTTYLTQIENKNYAGFVQQRFPYYYNLPQIYSNDFYDLQNQVVNNTLNFNMPTYKRFAEGSFPFILSGQYKIKLQYFMPDGTKGTESTFDYKNFIK